MLVIASAVGQGATLNRNPLARVGTALSHQECSAEQRPAASRGAPFLQERQPTGLGKGDPNVTFVVGAVLSFPGVSYLDALDHIHELNPGTVPTILLVLFICLMQQILLEVPLLGYVFAPESTQDRVARFRAWMGRKGRPAAVIGFAVIGLVLIARGVITLL
jgi:Sap, sulfolipid-1-addressing protein